MKMTVRTRLFLTIAGLALLLIVPTVYSVGRLAEVRDIALEQRARHASAFLALGRLQTALAEADRYLRSYVAAASPELRTEALRALQRSAGQLERLEELGYPRSTRPVAARLDTVTAATPRLEQLIGTGRVQEATALFETLKPALATALASLDGVAEAIDRRSAADLLEARRISAAAASSTLLAFVVSLVLAAIVGVWATTRLVRPLQRLRGAMATVAGGEFVALPGLPYSRTDEIGDLCRSFHSMTQRLSELERLRAEFVSVASHELKTPINVIGGYAELMQEGLFGPQTDRQREALASIREQTEALTRLVNQLLDISRMEAGGFQLELEEVHLRPLLERVRRSFAVLGQQKDVRLVLEVEASVPRAIQADGDRLETEVLGNLLSNAFKFTSAGGRVRLRVWGRAGAVHFEVSDTGVGIPPEDLPHIFDKFYQVGKQARALGAGLGLAIAHEVVESHGGRITVQSEPGRGTAFHVTLPAKPILLLARRSA